MSYEYAETSVQSSVQTPRATPEQIVNIANTIWDQIKKSKVDVQDENASEELLTLLQNEFKDFNNSFPLVLRWMVQTRQYSSAALSKYLKKHSTATLDTRESFLRLQAEYLVLLYKENNSHQNGAAIKNYRDSIVKQLLDEDKKFMKLQEIAANELTELQTAVDKERRQNIFNRIMFMKGNK